MDHIKLEKQPRKHKSDCNEENNESGYKVSLMEIAKDQKADKMLRTQDDGCRLELEPSLGIAQSAAQHRYPQHPPPDQEGWKHARDFRGDSPRPEELIVFAM